MMVPVTVVAIIVVVVVCCCFNLFRDRIEHSSSLFSTQNIGANMDREAHAVASCVSSLFKFINVFLDADFCQQNVILFIAFV